MATENAVKSDDEWLDELFEAINDAKGENVKGGAS